MNAFLHGFAKESFSASSRPLSIAVLYEDTDTHHQATAVWEFLVQQLAGEGDMTATWWRTSLLSDPKLARVAARAVASSDLIVISMHAHQKLDPTLKSWLDALPISNVRPNKLVALLRDRGDASALSEGTGFLKEWAGRRNLLLVEGTAAAFTRSTPAPVRDGNLPFPTPTPRIEPYMHGGLNE